MRAACGRAASKVSAVRAGIVESSVNYPSACMQDVECSGAAHMSLQLLMLLALVLLLSLALLSLRSLSIW